LSYDNTLYFSISKTKKTIISIGEPQAISFPIYTNEEFNFTNYNLSALDYNKLEEQDAIVVNELDEIPQALATTLKSFVEKVGFNYYSVRKEFRSKLEHVLVQFWKHHLQYFRKQKKTTKINFNHPIFDNVFE
jgi:hypothetical protein